MVKQLSVYGMKLSLSGNGGTTGTSKIGPAGPSGSKVSAPLEAKKAAIWLCAPTANGAAAAVLMLVKKVCGFFDMAPPVAAKAKSLRKNVARSARSPARISAVAVGFGTEASYA